MTIPNDLGGQIAELYREVAELKRRARNRKRTGTISEVDLEKGLARVKLSEPGGTPYITGWIPWKEVAAGGIKSHIPPTVDEQVDVVSENGDGTDALIDMSTPSSQNPRPHDGPEAVITKGNCTVMIGDDEIKLVGNVKVEGNLSVVGESVSVTGNLAVSGESLTHNGIFIGDTHQHTEVEPGGALSGPPPGD